MEICPRAYIFCKYRLKILPNTKKTLTQIAKDLNILPKCQNFAKSGHTAHYLEYAIYEEDLTLNKLDP